MKKLEIMFFVNGLLTVLGKQESPMTCIRLTLSCPVFSFVWEAPL